MWFFLLYLMLGFGLGAMRLDFLIRWHLAPGPVPRLRSLLWYLTATLSWPLQLYLEHEANKEMIRRAVEDI